MSFRKPTDMLTVKKLAKLLGLSEKELVINYNSNSNFHGWSTISGGKIESPSTHATFTISGYLIDTNNLKKGGKVAVKKTSKKVAKKITKTSKKK